MTPACAQEAEAGEFLASLRHIATLCGNGREEGREGKEEREERKKEKKQLGNLSTPV